MRKQVPVGENYSNADFFTSVRFFLIKILCGDTVVILNAEIESTEDPSGDIKLHDMKSVLICHNKFIGSSRSWRITKSIG